MPSVVQKRCAHCRKMKIRSEEFDRRVVLETTYLGAPKRYQWANYCRECVAKHPELASSKWPDGVGA